MISVVYSVKCSTHYPNRSSENMTCAFDCDGTGNQHKIQLSWHVRTAKVQISLHIRTVLSGLVFLTNRM